MSRDHFDTLLVGRLPAALSALCQSIEGQAHPWLLTYAKNITQKVVTLQEENAGLRSELSGVYRRLAKLERAVNGF